jgi:hypothetical protein
MFTFIKSLFQANHWSMYNFKWGNIEFVFIWNYKMPHNSQFYFQFLDKILNATWNHAQLQLQYHTYLNLCKSVQFNNFDITIYLWVRVRSEQWILNYNKGLWKIETLSTGIHFTLPPAYLTLHIVKSTNLSILKLLAFGHRFQLSNDSNLKSKSTL